MTSPLRVAPALTALEDSVAALAGGTPWKVFRRDAFDRLMTLGLPTPRDDGFKYANLRLLERRDLRPAPAAVAGPGMDLRDDALSIQFTNGTVVVPDEAALLAEGITGTMLRDELSGATPEQLGIEVPGDGPDDRLRLLSASLVADGVHLRVAPGARPRRPVHVVYVTSGGGAYPRLRITLGAGAQLTLIEEHHGAADSMTLAVSDITLEKDSVLSHVRLDAPATGFVLLEDVRVRAFDNAIYRQQSYASGAGLSRLELDVDLAAPGATAELTGLALVDAGRAAHVRPRVRHAAPATTSNQTYRAIAGARSRASYDGKVIVMHGASGAASRQSSRNLLLAPDAEIDTRPQLEIHTDEVTASHGATTGTLDEDMLFYLRSRGLDAATARALLTYAFAADVVRAAPLAAIRELLGRRIVGLLPEATVLKDFLS